MNRKHFYHSQQVPFVVFFGALRLLFSFTQLRLSGKVSFTNSSAAKARHVLVLLYVAGVIPGQLGARLHNTDTEEKKNRNQFKTRKKPERTVDLCCLTCW